MSALLFIVIAVLGTSVIAISNRTRSSWWVSALIAILVTGAIVLVGYSLTKPITLSEGSGVATLFRSTPIREFALFAFLLIGMAARVLSLAIEQREKLKSDPGKPDAGIQVDRWQFVYPMLFAIPTFGGLLSQIASPLLTLPDTILAFTTGFFWQTVLQKVEQR